MKKDFTRVPSSIIFYTNPLFVVVLMVTFIPSELLVLYSTRQPLYYLFVSIIGTLPFTISHIFSPPNFFKKGIMFISEGFRHSTKGISEQQKHYMKFIKSKEYKIIILRFGVFFASLPWFIFLISFIEFPTTWKAFYRPLPVWERLIVASLLQALLTGSGIIILFAFYLKKHWPKIMRVHD